MLFQNGLLSFGGDLREMGVAVELQGVEFYFLFDVVFGTDWWWLISRWGWRMLEGV